MYSMAGVTRNHGRIVPSPVVLLHAQLRGHDCEAASTDLRLSVGNQSLITYPDIFVTCGPDRYLDNRSNVHVFVKPDDVAFRRL